LLLLEQETKTGLSLGWVFPVSLPNKTHLVFLVRAKMRAKMREPWYIFACTKGV